MKTNLKSFAAGFLSTLIFHQGIIGLLFLLGLAPNAPFKMAPTSPLGVPSVISLAFFGGLWGIVIWKLVAKDIGKRHWIKTTLFGAIGPTAVAFLVVFPLKGMAVPMTMIPVALILNGAWGAGNSLFMKMMDRR
jgi:hypothetical protein